MSAIVLLNYPFISFSFWSSQLYKLLRRDWSWCFLDLLSVLLDNYPSVMRFRGCRFPVFWYFLINGVLKRKQSVSTFCPLLFRNLAAGAAAVSVTKAPAFVSLLVRKFKKIIIIKAQRSCFIGTADSSFKVDRPYRGIWPSAKYIWFKCEMNWQNKSLIYVFWWGHIFHLISF